jgi:hypothetical protein
MRKNDDEFEEPLKNIDLESSIMGIRMALSDEEKDEAREEFLKLFKTSQLAVPTGKPPQIAPDGRIMDLQLILSDPSEGEPAIRVFTTLTDLRVKLPGLQHGIVLPAWQIAGIAAGSPHELRVEGPHALTIITRDELTEILAELQRQAQESQKGLERNERLEAAIEKLHQGGGDEVREEVAAAFLDGFCRLPVIIEADGQVPHCVVTGQAGPNQPQQSIALKTHDGALLCFTSEAALNRWDARERPMMVLPGRAIVEVSQKSSLHKIRVDEGGPGAQTIQVGPKGDLTIN